MKENNDCLTHPAVTTTDLRTLPIHEEFDFYTITIEMLIFDMVIDSSAIEMGSLYVLGKTKIAVAVHLSVGELGPPSNITCLR